LLESIGNREDKAEATEATSNKMGSTFKEEEDE
jgi:hypothetical protein